MLHQAMHLYGYFLVGDLIRVNDSEENGIASQAIGSSADPGFQTINCSSLRWGTGHHITAY